MIILKGLQFGGDIHEGDLAALSAGYRKYLYHYGRKCDEGNLKGNKKDRASYEPYLLHGSNYPYK